MINRLFDSLIQQIENAGQNIPSIIEITISLIWVFIIWKYKISYQTSLKISLGLLLLSVLTFILAGSVIAGFVGEYILLFLGIGIIQAIATKEA